MIFSSICFPERELALCMPGMYYIYKYLCSGFTVDWIIANMLAIRQNALGHIRYVLKDGLKWLPLYGWYFSQVNLNFVSVFLFVYHIYIAAHLTEK